MNQVINFKLPSYLVYFILFLVVFSSCSKDKEPIYELTPLDREVIHYFKKIALGFPNPGISELTRKWTEPMKIYVDHDDDILLNQELKEIIDELNELFNDGFQIEIVKSEDNSNFKIYLSDQLTFSQLFPEYTNFLESNMALFNVRFNSGNQLNSGYMFVDTKRGRFIDRTALLRSLLTRSLGLAKQSNLYPTSIFFAPWKANSEFNQKDKKLISLLYSPYIKPGLDEFEVEPRLKVALSISND